MTEEEMRLKAIDKFENGESPKVIYEDLGRTKQWFFKWLKRYQSGDTDWYRSRSRAPQRKPNKISEVERQRIIFIRQRLQRQSFSQIGVSAIKWELHKAGVPIPSDRTINRVLKKEGLVKKNCLCPKRDRIPILQGGPVSKQHTSSRSFGPSLHQGRRQILFLQRDRYGDSPSLYRITTEQGRPADRLQPHEMLENDGYAGLSTNGQRPYLSRQQPLPEIFWPGDQAMSLLWGHPGVHPDSRALA